MSKTKNIDLLKDKLIIAQLNISKWGAKAYDKKASTTVETAYHTQSNIGRFQKEIIDGKELKTIDRLSAEMRILHIDNTLPWGDNGDRLLPTTNFDFYQKEMNRLIGEFDAEVVKFLEKYPLLKQTARERLGGLFDSKNYPNDVSNKFNVRINYFPVPIADDISLNLPTVDVRSIKENITKTVNGRIEDAIKDIWVRMEILLNKLIERLSDNDNKFKNSLIDNIAAIISIVPKLNVFNDPNLDETCKKMKELLVEPDNLRTDTSLRKLIVEKAIELSNQVKSFGAAGARTLEL